MKLGKYKKIKTSLPVNLKEKNAEIFRKRKYYKIPKLKSKLINNVFLTHYGIPLKYLLPIRYTLPNAFGFKKPNAGFFLNFYFKALEIYIVSKLGKSLKKFKLNNKNNYLLAYTPWFGYFSWVTESLPRIISVKENHQNLILIMPDFFLKKKFVVESLSMFPNLKKQVIKEGVNMIIPKLTIPELKPYTYVFDPETMNNFRKQVWNFVDNLSLNIETYEKIYVSRNKAKNRNLVNATEVKEVFKSYGYKEIYFEDYTFFEQVFLMKNCRVLAGVHGAGFANASFLPKKSVLFELIKEYSSYKEERPSYWRLCSCINVNYYVQYCEPREYGNYDLWVGVDLIANINELKENLSLIEQSCNFS